MAPLHRSTAAPQPQPDQLQIQHFTHQHLLQKLFIGSQFNCDGCKTIGFGLRYQCSACDFDLHQHCATSPYRLSSHRHPHQLVLLNRPGNSHFCDVCKGFTDGLSYTCQTCDQFDAHPHCAQMPVATGVPLTSNPSQQQQQGGVAWAPPMAASGGCNNQPVMMNHQYKQNLQPQQGMPTTAYGGYNNQPVMINRQQHQQQQGIPMVAYAGYTNQHVLVNQHQQQQGIPTAAFGGYNNQHLMFNHQYLQQQQGMPMAAFGGNNNQPVMMNHQQQQHQQQQQQGRTNNLSKVGKIAANILMTSLIGVPINFNSKK